MKGRADGVIANVLVPCSVLSRPGQMPGTRMGDCLQGDLIVRGGRVAGLRPTADVAAPRHMILPALTEVHVHLDKCHTADRLPAVGGDLRAAIDAQARDHVNWTTDDLRSRMMRGLRELAAAGCGLVRSHIDWPDDGSAPLAWSILKEALAEMPLRVQQSPLLGVDKLARSGLAQTIAEQVSGSGGVLGGFVHLHRDREAGIRAMFAAAERFGLALDFHVDEGLENGLDGLVLIARIALETGFQGPILCGHACSLMNRDGAELARALELIAKAGLFVAALPTTNLYLQGRGGGTPDRRGITRLHELRNAGVRCLIGTDNVRDAFCPIGRHDPRASLALAVMAAHLDPPLGDRLPMITTDAALALGCDPVHVDGAALADLRLFEATSTDDLLAGVQAPQVPDAYVQNVGP
ncbi:amidohydrolase family protein [Sulfitobacter sp. EhC04]|uniref:amidohydrolase family protein n=1 Tax=Sulfitobacter sp. EhC04 TaxID=1849168 RepID=UPI000AF61D85|nr:amidohydrolase family protein [Sulfitobacter sp. EhC04]